MSDRVPSFLLLVPGPWDSADPVIASLRSAGIEATPPTNDPFAAGAVEVSFVFDPQLGRNVAATGAALPELVGLRQGVVVEIGLRLDEDPAGLARLGHALRAAGGVAVRMERSGRSFAWEPWLERVSRGTVSDLYELGVMLVQDDAGFVQDLRRGMADRLRVSDKQPRVHASIASARRGVCSSSSIYCCGFDWKAEAKFSRAPVSSAGTTHTLFDSPLAISGSACRYW